MDAARLDAFVASARRAGDAGQLAEVIQEAAHGLGFDYVALVRDADLVRPAAPRESMKLVIYPEAWRARLGRRREFRDDPVLAACRLTAAPFLWSELPRLIALSRPQKAVLAAAAACGLAEGLTVPIAVPGEVCGSCSYALRPGREVPRSEIPAAQYMGCIAFEAARRILGGRGRFPAAPPPARLSGRQLECVVLAAQGKSDWHIAQLLGIGRHTVHQHMEAAKRRYGVASRTQLAVRALFDGQIAFADVMEPSPD